MVVPAPLPLPVVHRRSVHEQDHSASPARAFLPQTHVERERTLRALEPVAQHTVQDRDDGIAFGTRCALAEQRIELAQQPVTEHTDEARYQLYVAVRDPSDDASRDGKRLTEDASPARDTQMHGVHDIHDARRREHG
jgi:hypothetical protein